MNFKVFGHGFERLFSAKPTLLLDWLKTEEGETALGQAEADAAAKLPEHIGESEILKKTEEFMND